MTDVKDSRLLELFSGLFWDADIYLRLSFGGLCALCVLCCFICCAWSHYRSVILTVFDSQKGVDDNVRESVSNVGTGTHGALERLSSADISWQPEHFPLSPETRKLDKATKKLLLISVCCLHCGEHGLVMAANSTEPVQLHFMYMTSRSRINTSGSLLGIDLALEIINQDPSFLPGYQLNYTMVLDSKCDRQESLRVFFGEILATENFTQYLALLGAGCSAASIPVAEIIPFYNMPMISYLSTADELANRNVYKTFFRTVFAEEGLVKGFVSLIHLHNWTQLTFITQKEIVFTSVVNNVTMSLNGSGVNVISRSFSSNGDPLEVHDLFAIEDNMRIFIINTYEGFARRILCEAYRLWVKEMKVPRYTWIIYGWYSEDWWKRDKDSLPDVYNCTETDMLKILNSSLSIIHLPLLNRTLVSDSGLTVDEFLNKTRQDEEIALFAFDAVWTLALALNTSISMVSKGIDSGCSDRSSPLVPYENFTYSNDKLLCILQNNLQASNFSGITGPIHFNEKGNRATSDVRLQQYRVTNSSDTSDLVVTVGTISAESEFMFLLNENLSTLWPDGIPLDGTPIEDLSDIDTGLSAVLMTLSIIGMAFATVCLLFNIICRKRKVVRLTSPNLNYIMIAGAFLLYSSVIFLAIPSADKPLLHTINCNLIVWLFFIGNTMCFAVVLSKLARVYYIFSDPTPYKKIIKDYHLLVVIVILVGVDALILLVPTILDISRLTVDTALDKELGTGRNSEDIPLIYTFYICRSLDRSSSIWQGISFAYKLILQFIAVYFAFRTRKVEIEVLNDSKPTTAIVYTTSLLLVVILGTMFGAGSSRPNLYKAVVGIATLIYPTVILSFTFIPKMIHLYKDPQGETIFASTPNNTLGDAVTVLGTVRYNGDNEDEARVQALERKVKELETKLSNFKQSAAELEAVSTDVASNDDDENSVEPRLSASELQAGERLAVSVDIEETQHIALKRISAT